MITTVGKHIRVEIRGYIFERTAEGPGVVTLRVRGGGATELPGNAQEAEQFIAAYQRAIKEDVGYREMKAE